MTTGWNEVLAVITLGNSHELLLVRLEDGHIAIASGSMGLAIGTAGDIPKVISALESVQRSLGPCSNQAPGGRTAHICACAGEGGI